MLRVIWQLAYSSFPRIIIHFEKGKDEVHFKKIGHKRNWLRIMGNSLDASLI